jgi:hypothetical protein
MEVNREVTVLLVGERQRALSALSPRLRIPRLRVSSIAAQRVRRNLDGCGATAMLRQMVRHGARPYPGESCRGAEITASSCVLNDSAGDTAHRAAESVYIAPAHSD